MDRFFRITDSSKVRGGSNAVVDGTAANYDEWARHNFLPKEGVVGHLLADGYIREGMVYILECAPGIIVPILPSGVTETTEYEFNSRWQQNLTVGRATKEEVMQAKNDEIFNSMFNF